MEETLQEKQIGISTEVQDQVFRSNKKIKPNEGEGNHDAAVTEEERDPQPSPKPMDQSPIEKEKEEKVEGQPSNPKDPMFNFLNTHKQVAVGEEAFGPWMLVDRTARRKPRANYNQNPQKNQQGNQKSPQNSVVLLDNIFEAIEDQANEDSMNVDNDIQEVPQETHDPVKEQRLEESAPQSTKQKNGKQKIKKVEGTQGGGRNLTPKKIGQNSL
ncbi:uncharacterized protein G2W53_028015 [Senna tora]|uniref:Uncharacterized protein n=1 Tax=Senna tora TaxID=362788 RepID=A0A834T2D1_9FABA|nr:uncharacterized protein G2W53_028015 [Senna tora]